MTPVGDPHASSKALTVHPPGVWLIHGYDSASIAWDRSTPPGVMGAWVPPCDTIGGQGQSRSYLARVLLWLLLVWGVDGN